MYVYIERERERERAKFEIYFVGFVRKAINVYCFLLYVNVFYLPFRWEEVDKNHSPDYWWPEHLLQCLAHNTFSTNIY